MAVLVLGHAHRGVQRAQARRARDHHLATAVVKQLVSLELKGNYLNESDIKISK